MILLSQCLCNWHDGHGRLGKIRTNNMIFIFGKRKKGLFLAVTWIFYTFAAKNNDILK